MSNKPTHYLSIVTGDGDAAKFTRVCGVWRTESGALSFSIPQGMTISGRFVINEARTDTNGGGQ